GAAARLPGAAARLPGAAARLPGAAARLPGAAARLPGGAADRSGPSRGGDRGATLCRGLDGARARQRASDAAGAGVAA
ncbi:hypothetical protein PQF33_00915, partial [Dactylosporangium aurantiacum]|uniref:hypothetical protein n=1 Tax=Dactylosporangium aurantiacum TaxID=35754 RepID=UPI002435F8BB